MREYSDRVKKNEKFSITDHEESDLGAHVYMFAFFGTSRKTKEYNQIQLINNNQIQYTFIHGLFVTGNRW